MNMTNKRLFSTFATVALGMGLLASSALARGSDEEYSSTFSRITGGAIVDLKMGVDGGSVSEGYGLVHVVCSDGSKQLRVMLLASPEDDGTIFAAGGEKSTLSKVGDTYQVTFKAAGQHIRKSMELKPVNDPKSNYESQFVVKVTYGDPLWNALSSDKQGAAIMLIGEGGKDVSVPRDPKLDSALKSCGLFG